VVIFNKPLLKGIQPRVNRKESNMFEASEKACTMIKEFLNNKPDAIQSVRILLAGGG
jgi:hypothetical protein